MMDLGGGCILCMAIIYSMLSVISASSGGHIQGADNGGPLHLELAPPRVQQLPVSLFRWVVINCSSASSSTSSSSSASSSYSNLTVTITSRNQHVATPFSHHSDPDNNRTDQISFSLDQNQQSVFAVKAQSVGHAVFVIHVSAEWEDVWLAIMEYHISVIRKLRVVDIVFDCAMAGVAMLNSFSLGCVTDWASLRMHLRHPTSLLMAASCHFLFLPMVAVAVVKAVGLEQELGLGLFYVACVPAGGGGHVMVAITQSDRALSISLNFIFTFMAVGTAPLWMFSMSYVMGAADIPFQLYNFEIWLGASAGAYLLGIFVRLCSEKGTEAYLNWFAKPFLLLFVILFVTLGVYINIYMFNVLSVGSMVAGGCLPMLGYFIGLVVSSIGRQESDYIKTIATECTIHNCLLVLVMVRFSLPQPAADLTSIMPIWVVFTSPAPFILACFCNRIKSCMRRRCAKRREKKYRHFSIVSSLLNVTNVTNLSASMSPKLNSPQDGGDNDSHMLVDEKVTVL